MSARDELSAYLWDGAGPADAEVQRLEALLAPVGYRESARPAPMVRPAPARPGRAWLALAAMLALAVSLAVYTSTARRAGWPVNPIDGAPMVGARAVRETGRLKIGQWLTTDAGSRAQVEVPGLGSVTVDENTRLRLVRAGRDEKRLALERGTIHAFIVAPPRLFLVDTPSGVAADLGCAYTLTVAEDGVSDLAVTSGWVELQGAGRVSTIPAGAVCRMDKARGPGTPYFPDTPARLLEQIAAIDAGRAGDLGGLEAAVTPREGLPLWHLIPRLEGSARADVVEALARVVPPPAGVSIEAAEGLDAAALEAWWGAVKEAW